jgi:hypothetical protein
MDPILSALTGYRSDLDLQQYWWHRLLKVLGILLLLAVGGLAGLFRYDEESRTPRQFTVDKGESLHQFMLARDHNGITKGHVSAFYEAEGESGVLEDSRLKWRYLTDEQCNVGKMVAGVGGVPIDPPEPFSYCTGKPDVEPEAVFKYRAKPWSPAVYAGFAAMSAGFWMLLTATVGMTLYYRGFVYVMCGPRRDAAGHSKTGTNFGAPAE